VGDIIILAEAPNRSHVDKTIRKLLKEGMIARIGSSPCADGTASEHHYEIPSPKRDRYRVEVLR